MPTGAATSRTEGLSEAGVVVLRSLSADWSAAVAFVDDQTALNQPLHFRLPLRLLRRESEGVQATGCRSPVPAPERSALVAIQMKTARTRHGGRSLWLRRSDLVVVVESEPGLAEVAALREPFGRLGGGHWACDVRALREVAANVRHRLEGVWVFDALGDDPEVECVGGLNYQRDEAFLAGVRCVSEHSVDLEGVGR